MKGKRQGGRERGREGEREGEEERERERETYTGYEGRLSEKITIFFRFPIISVKIEYK